jgi:hypothetical protein
MSPQLITVPQWQRERAMILHENFKLVDEDHGKLMQSLQNIAFSLDGMCLDGCRPLAASTGTLRREYSKWKKAGRTIDALLPDYKPGEAKVPRELIVELRRRATMPGTKAFSVAVKTILFMWKDGKEIPGLGCWPDWWRANHPKEPMPDQAPDFPFSRSTLYRYQPSKALSAAGTKGAKAAKEQLPYIEMDYASLRAMELITLDDVRLDLKAIDPQTGLVVDLVSYCVIEAASRMILGFVLRPAGSILQADVDALIGHVLMTFGVGAGYSTHIIFERGSVACSDAKQRMLEGLSDGSIKVHRTGMVGGIRWVGQGADSACGNPCGKAIIESFNRTLHLMLNNLPGQRGNCYQNQPQNLDAVCRDAEQLAQIEARTGVELKKPLLTIHEVSLCMRVAIDEYNNAQGRDFSGHGEVYQQEVQPGVWKDYQPVTESHAREALAYA